MAAEHSFGHWVQQCRKARDLTQVALAQAVGCSVSAIRKIESDQRRPSRLVAERLADVLMLVTEERHAFLQAARRLAGAARPLPPSNLPIPQTSFCGRMQECDMIHGLLRRTDVRLLTLTGAGGVGKTRLALHVAAEMQEYFTHGVWFVALAEVRDPTFMLAAIAQAIGVKETGRQSLQDVLQQHLHTQKALLVLDNFEHVRAATPLLTTFLAAAPHLKLLVTSRVVLKLADEHEVVVSPLALPNLLRLPSAPVVAHYAAITLFADRARTVEPTFIITRDNAAIIAELCVHLDGLPLAIELMAARLRLFSPALLLDRVSHRLQLLTGGSHAQPPRLQTLRAALDWSYELLDRPSQVLFARMSVFAGSFGLAAVEALYQPAMDPPIDVLNTVTTLLDHHLLQRERDADGDARFMMLETIREYAQERLAVRGEEHAIRRQQAMYYSILVETSASELRGSNQKLALDRLEREHNNIRAVLHWALQDGDAEVALRLSSLLWVFWNSAGHITEGRRWLEAALALGPTASAALRARAQGGAGVLAQLQGDYGAAVAFHEQSLALLRDLNDTKEVAQALNRLGVIKQHLGAYRVAQALYEESLTLFQQIDEWLASSLPLMNLGTVAEYAGEYERARICYEESLSIFREFQDWTSQGMALANLGSLAEIQGDYEQARAFVEQALRLFRDQGVLRGVAMMLIILGRIALQRQDYYQARTCCQESLVILQKQGALGYIGECFQLMAALAGAQAHPLLAARFAGAAQRLQSKMKAETAVLGLAVYDPIMARARTQLDVANWTAAWNEGYAMTVDAAVTYALHYAEESHGP
jgi:predicted ATPase/DNA-binding XRE family transcriptional regulator